MSSIVKGWVVCEESGPLGHVVTVRAQDDFCKLMLGADVLLVPGDGSMVVVPVEELKKRVNTVLLATANDDPRYVLAQGGQFYIRWGAIERAILDAEFEEIREEYYR
ncbi:MAG TPA: hypothetical protein VNA25_22660 [Phycisphaerae bacterium]|nr:hypothetical protein [Phycisphaerae bacterium]